MSWTKMWEKAEREGHRERLIKSTSLPESLSSRLCPAGPPPHRRFPRRCFARPTKVASSFDGKVFVFRAVEIEEYCRNRPRCHCATRVNLDDAKTTEEGFEKVVERVSEIEKKLSIFELRQFTPE
jgi:hypothetical protein